jgi:hypothetical protein
MTKALVVRQPLEDNVIREAIQGDSNDWILRIAGVPGKLEKRLRGGVA